jgi:hypothetical protein
MQDKRLVNIGNSLGLVIEKPILRILGIGTASLLRIWCDGRRIIIEPTGERVTLNQRARSLRPDDTPAVPPRTPDVDELIEDDEIRSDALQVFRELVRRWSISVEEFASLHHLELPQQHPRYMVRYEGWCDMEAEKATGAELATIKRMEWFRDLLREGVDREAAVKEALRAVPK